MAFKAELGLLIDITIWLALNTSSFDQSVIYCAIIRFFSFQSTFFCLDVGIVLKDIIMVFIEQ